MKKINTIILILVLTTSLTGCGSKENEKSNDSSNNVLVESTDTAEISSQVFNNNDNKSPFDGESSFNGENFPESQTDFGSLSINSDVLWGIGKTFDEIAEKYGEVVSGNHNAYVFENGYGRYAWDLKGIDMQEPDREKNIEIIRGNGGCKIIFNISAGDFLNGDISVLNLDNLASKCGFEDITRGDSPYSLYDGYKFKYYTHPSYENMVFIMCYKESGFDEDTTFDIRYDYFSDTEQENQPDILE